MREGSLQDRIGSSLLIGLALAVPAVLCFRSQTLIADPDIWWHLKAADWILFHGAWPSVDPFSYYGAGNAWAAYSWLPELTLRAAYALFGLTGLVVWTATTMVLIAAAFHHLVFGLRPNVTLSVVLTALFAVALTPLATPRPWLVSVLLFILEVDLLLSARRRRDPRLLLWLIPLFLVWANCHIQFVAGLVVLGFAMIEPLVERGVARLAAGGETPTAEPEGRWASIAWMPAVFYLCVAATLVNPYHYHLYEVALQLLEQKELWNWIEELKAMSFRTIPHWIVLGSTLAAVFVLGSRAKGRSTSDSSALADSGQNDGEARSVTSASGAYSGPKIRPLLPMMLALGCYCAFRSQRDTWLLLVPAMAIATQILPGRLSLAARLPRRLRLVSWAVPAAVILLGGLVVLHEEDLERKVAGTYPVEAVRFLKGEEFSGPIYNRFSWGGYLMYHLPEFPVGIDGRTMVHGEERVIRSFKTLVGQAGWREDVELNAAGVVLLPKESILTKLIDGWDRFRRVYEDDVAVVFVPER